MENNKDNSRKISKDDEEIQDRRNNLLLFITLYLLSACFYPEESVFDPLGLLSTAQSTTNVQQQQAEGSRPPNNTGEKKWEAAAASFNRDVPPTDWNNLPADILNNICSRLRLSDLKQLRLCKKSWKPLVDDIISKRSMFDDLDDPLLEHILAGLHMSELKSMRLVSWRLGKASDILLYKECRLRRCQTLQEAIEVVMHENIITWETVAEYFGFKNRDS